MGTTVVSVIGVAVVTAACLWLLFRRGSMTHRAERDYDTDIDAGRDADTDADRDGSTPTKSA